MKKITVILVLLFSVSFCQADDKSKKHPGQSVIEKFFKLATASKTDAAMKLVNHNLERRFIVGIGKISNRKGRHSKNSGLTILALSQSYHPSIPARSNRTR